MLKKLMSYCKAGANTNRDQRQTLSPPWEMSRTYLPLRLTTLAAAAAAELNESDPDYTILIEGGGVVVKFTHSLRQLHASYCKLFCEKGSYDAKWESNVAEFLSSFYHLCMDWEEGLDHFLTLDQWDLWMAAGGDLRYISKNLDLFNKEEINKELKRLFENSLASANAFLNGGFESSDRTLARKEDRETVNVDYAKEIQEWRKRRLKKKTPPNKKSGNRLGFFHFYVKDSDKNECWGRCSGFLPNAPKRYSWGLSIVPD
jgi:hypothetical protein